MKALVRHNLFCLLAASVFLALPVAAGAASLQGVTLPDQITVDGHTLVLNGIGLRTKFFFKVYVGGLYLPHVEHSAARILTTDEPRRVVMHFVRSVSQGQICGAWKDGLADNTPNASAEVKKKFDTLCSLMADVEDGQTITLTYLPGTGSEIDVAGKQTGTIAGADFATALFACFIGPQPPGETFKKALLGKAEK